MQDVQFGELKVCHLVEAGENGELGRDWKGKASVLVGVNNKLWKILKEMGIPDHLTCLLRNLYKPLELDMEQQTGYK